MLIHDVTRGNEGGSGDLFSVETKPSLLRIVLAVGKCSWNSFAGMLVSESLLIGIRIRWSSWFGRMRVGEVELRSNEFLPSWCFSSRSRRGSNLRSPSYLDF